MIRSLRPSRSCCVSSAPAPAGFLFRTLARCVLPLAALAFAAAGARGQTAHYSPSILALGGGFSGPTSVAVDGAGNVYVADELHNAVKKIPAGCTSSACVTTLGGGFSSPYGVAVDAFRNVYVADKLNNAVKEVPAGCVSSSCVKTLGGGFSSPYGVAVDGAGNVYVASTGTTVAEMPPACASSSCVTALGGGFTSPRGIAVDAAGKVYVADDGGNAVKEMTAGCVSSSCVTTLGAGFSAPTGVAVDLSGTVFVADQGNNEVKVMSPGCASSSCVSPVGSGFNQPFGVAVDGGGNLFIADSGNNAAKEIPLSSVRFPTEAVGSTSGVTTLTFTFDSGGKILAPAVLTMGAKGLDFADKGTGTCTTNGSSHVYSTGDTCTVNATFAAKDPGLRMGAVELLNSSSSVIASVRVFGFGTGAQAVFSPPAISSLGGGLSYPLYAAVDSAGNAYVADTNLNEILEVPVGCATSSCVKVLGGGFGTPEGVAVDGAGNVYVTDLGDNAMKEIPAGCLSAGCVITLGGGFSSPQGNPAVDASGNVYVPDTGTDSGDDAVKEIPPGCFSAGCVITLGSGGFSAPTGVAVDGGGNVYVADIGNVYAGNAGRGVKGMPPGCASSSCVVPLGGGFAYPYSVAVDGSGNIYVADTTANALKVMPPNCASSTCVTTVASFFQPPSIAVDGSGNLYVPDPNSSAMRELNRARPPVLNFATTAPGQTSSDSPQTVTVQNIGTSSLNFTAIGYPADFPEASGVDTDCTSTTKLAGAATCTLTIDFSPLAKSVTGTNTQLNESVSLTDNSLSGTSVVQKVTVNGTEISQPAAMTSPTPNTVLVTGPTVTFTWSSAPGSTSYSLRIGTTQGANDLYASGSISTTYATAMYLPTDGSTLYVRLYTNYSSGPVYTDYVFTAATQATLISPRPSTTLAGPKITFTWRTGVEATTYGLRIGTTLGGNDLYASGTIRSTSVTPTNLPTNGEIMFVRLSTDYGSVQSFIDYVFIAPTQAALTSPTSGTTLAGTKVTFTWSAGARATSYAFHLGSTVGGDDLYASGTITSTSVTPTTLPTNGKTVYARLYTNFGSSQVYTDYVFTAATAAALTSPLGGATLGSSQAFTWSAGTGTSYSFRLGTAVGGNNLYVSGTTTKTTVTAPSLPTNGETIYGRLYTTYTNGSQSYADYIFTAAP